MKSLFKNAFTILTRPVPLWLLALLLVPFLLLLGLDPILLHTARFAEDSPLQTAAQFLSHWGDFYTGCAYVILATFLFGLVARKRTWGMIALAALFAGALSGLTATTLRFVAGRPRPSAGIADGLYGPRFALKKGRTLPDYNYNSFPSAHATTALASAMPFLIIEPVVGVPLTATAILVGWSRFQLGRHNPSDIYLGFLIGGIFGYAFGKAAMMEQKL